MRMNFNINVYAGYRWLGVYSVSKLPTSGSLIQIPAKLPGSYPVTLKVIEVKPRSCFYKRFIGFDVQVESCLATDYLL